MLISEHLGLRWFARIALGLALAASLAIPGSGGRIVLAANTADLSSVELPPDIGQSEIQVYIPETRHTLRGSMLDYWRANGAAAVYGYPISEPFAADNGYYSQAFETAIFQYHPEYLYTDEPIMRLMPIGPVALSARLDMMRRDGRRGFGGGDRRYAAWQPLPPDSQAAARAIAEGGIYVEDTGHTVRGAFYAWYASHEGPYYLGDPLSQPVNERGVVVQYFTGALLLRGAGGVVRLAPLARELAPYLRIDTKPVKRNGLPRFSESLFVTAPNPNPQGDPSAPGRKWIEVSISQQTLWAYQGSTLILTSLVSTGLPPNETERGVFHVRLKYPTQDMRGFESSTGEVVGFGDEAPPGGVISYDVKDVPNVMYFNMDAEALHGAYWHNNFGQRMSHGCINLPLSVAAFLYGWAPLGTMVWVHD